MKIVNLFSGWSSISIFQKSSSKEAELVSKVVADEEETEGFFLGHNASLIQPFELQEDRDVNVVDNAQKSLSIFMRMQHKIYSLWLRFFRKDS